MENCKWEMGDRTRELGNEKWDVVDRQCIEIIQLKALWGGHTAALQFMLFIQFPIGEGKHAIRSRRLHEDEIVTACTAGNSTEMVLICLYVGQPKHVLHEISLFKYRVRRAFLHKMTPDAMQKKGNFTADPCDKADDA